MSFGHITIPLIYLMICTISYTHILRASSFLDIGTLRKDSDISILYIPHAGRTRHNNNNYHSSTGFTYRRLQGFSLLRCSYITHYWQHMLCGHTFKILVVPFHASVLPFSLLFCFALLLCNAMHIFAVHLRLLMWFCLQLTYCRIYAIQPSLPPSLTSFHLLPSILWLL